ncbi:MAG: HAD-IIIA family hydrolase [Casimicrobiaceae bacterium]
MGPIITQTIRAVIFDLDGTLIDTAAEIAVALNRTLGERGLPALTKKNVENLIGRGVRSMVERALKQVGASDYGVDAAVARFEAHYTKTVGTEAELFPGVLPGLLLLREKGYKMSVVTNKPRYFTERLLERLEVKMLFTGLVTGDDGIRRKPHGDMLDAACRAMGSSARSSLMIGDSDHDVIAARNVGCPVWCVRYGYNEGRSPETLACDRLVASVQEAARLLVNQP